jgi:hypothetical protein
VPFVPNRFLFRLAVPCRFVGTVPTLEGDELVDLPESCRLDNFAALDERRNFADVRLGWNEGGIALQVEVSGKGDPPAGDAARPGSSDGFTLWLDTRDARSGHRASRFCHQFHFLPTGGGPEKDEPVVVQTRIHRAQQDAPLAPDGAIPFRGKITRAGYRLEAFLPASVLTGLDPEQNPRLGVAYLVRDRELGEQMLGAGTDFPLGEDPSLWSVLDLVRS